MGFCIKGLLTMGKNGSIGMRVWGEKKQKFIIAEQKEGN